MTEKKFTVAEFRKYVEQQDSLGDVLYFLHEDSIETANMPHFCFCGNESTEVKETKFGKYTPCHEHMDLSPEEYNEKEAEAQMNRSHSGSISGEK